MHGPQMLRRMCGSSVNKAVHVLATILLVHLVRQPSKKLDLTILVFCLFIRRLHDMCDVSLLHCLLRSLVVVHSKCCMMKLS